MSMVPLFIHVLSNGQIWVSVDVSFTPVGTILAPYKVTSLPPSQLIGTLTATAGAVTASSGSTGKFPAKDIS